MEEIVERYAPDFAALGADSQLRFVPCLNDSAGHVDVITAIVAANLQGWEEVLLPVGAVPSIPETLDHKAVKSA